MGGEEFKWRQPAHHKLWSQQGPHFSPHSTAKRIVSSGISDVVIASVHSENEARKVIADFKFDAL